MQKQTELGLLREHSVSGRDRKRILRRVDARALWVRRSSPATGWPSIARGAEDLQERSRYLSSELMSQLSWVAGHSGTALLLRKSWVTSLTAWLMAQSPNWHEVKRNIETSSAAVRACSAITFFLGAVGLRPLAERYDKESGYFVHALGFEEQTYKGSRFKLPNEASTLYPNRPFGAALFGDERGGRLDVLCPDVVAFAMLDKKFDVRHVGPYLYSVESIESEVKRQHKGGSYKADVRPLEHWTKAQFSIRPDTDLPESQLHGFGGIDRINILGERAYTDKHPDGREAHDGRKYMRFVVGRTFDSRTNGPPLGLVSAIEELERNQGGKPVHLNRGDVLLVNNRRVATRWRKEKWEWVQEGFLPWAKQELREERIEPGDRLILRMSFYYPREIPADGGVLGAPAAVSSPQLR